MAPPRSTETKVPRVTRQASYAPVDTFVAPPATNGASQLAAALGEFNPALRKFSQELLDRDNAEKLQAGIAEAQKLAAAGKEAAALTREGQLAMQDNAWFRAGLEEEEGRIAATQWRSSFIASDEFKAIEGSSSLEDFDAAAAKFNARFAPSGSEFYQRGFGTLQSNYQAAARYEFATGIESKLGTRSDAALHARTMTIIEEDTRAGVDPQVTAAAINHLAQQFEARGRPEKATRAALADALEAAARNMDPSDGLKLVALWDLVKGEGGGSLRQSKYGAEQREKLQNDLIAEVWRKEARDIEAAERTEKLLIDQAQREYAQALAKSPTDTGQSILSRPEYQSVRHKLTRAFASQIQESDALVFKSNEYVVRNVLTRIFDPQEGGPQVTTAFIGQLRNVSPADKVMLNNQLEARERAKESGSWDRLYKDPAIAEQRKLIEAYFADPLTKLVPREKETKYGAALLQFNARVLLELETGEYDKQKPGQRLAWLSAVRAEAGVADPTIMNSQDIQGVSSRPIDPNQPELGNTPTGFQPAGRLGDRGKPQSGKVEGSETGAAQNPFTGMKLVIRQELLDAAMDPSNPLHDEAVDVITKKLDATQQAVTEANIQFFIDAQIEALRAAGTK